MTKQKDTEIEATKWYKNTMAVVAMVGALAGGLYGLVEVLRLFEPKKVMENVELVLDSSAVMNEPFDDGTKWDLAMRAVQETLSVQVADSDNLAFRVFGGSCLGESTELVLDFRQDNKEKILSALQDLEREGEPALASAIVEASGDFNDPERFEGVNKTIIVITGGGDTCHPDAMEYIANRLRDKEDIKTSWRYIGIGLAPAEAAQVSELADRTAGLAFFPENSDEVVTVVGRLHDADYAAELAKPREVAAKPAPPARREATPQQTFRAGVDVEAPKKVHDVPPVYPKEAQRKRREGAVIMEATIDEKGNVTNLKVLRSMHTFGLPHPSGGIPLLEEAALEAVRQWKYEPTMLRGAPVSVVMTVTVRFHLPKS
jgi:TonB family protein